MRTILKILVLLQILIFIGCGASSQELEDKAMQKMAMAIEQNDTIKLAKALSKNSRANYQLGNFKDAIKSKRLNELKFILNNREKSSLHIGSQISPSVGLTLAAEENNLEIFNLILEYKPTLKYVVKDISGTVTFERGYYKYKTENIFVGSSAMYYAIKNLNISMIKNLLSNGYDVNLPVIIEPFHDFSDGHFGIDVSYINYMIETGNHVGIKLDYNNSFSAYKEDGFYYVTYEPTAAIKSKVIELAKKTKNLEIIEIFSDTK